MCIYAIGYAETREGHEQDERGKKNNGHNATDLSTDGPAALWANRCLWPVRRQASDSGSSGLGFQKCRTDPQHQSTQKVQSIISAPTFIIQQVACLCSIVVRDRV